MINYRAIGGFTEAGKAAWRGMKVAFGGFGKQTTLLSKTSGATLGENFTSLLKTVNPLTSDFYKKGGSVFNEITSSGESVWKKATKTFKDKTATLTDEIDFSSIDDRSLYNVVQSIFHNGKSTTEAKDLLSKRVESIGEVLKLKPGKIDILKEIGEEVLNNKRLTVTKSGGAEQVLNKMFNNSNAATQKTIKNRFMNNYVDNHKRMTGAMQTIGNIGVMTSVIGGTVNVAADALNWRSPARDKYGRLDIPYVPFI